MSRRDAVASVGLQLFPGSPKRLVEEAKIVEDLGFSSVWVADHFFGGGRDKSWAVPEVVAVLGAMAQATSVLRLGTCVVSLVKRNPAIVAHAALTLNNLASGRFELGVGTGFGPDLRAFGFDLSSPVGRFEEAIGVIRRLFDASEEEPASAEGRHFTLRDAFLNVPDTDAPPLHVAAVGRRMLKLTGDFADGWLPFGLTPELYSEFLSMIKPVRPGFTPGLWLPVFVERPGEDRGAEAEATGRLYLSMAPDVLKRITPQPDDRMTSATKWSPEAGQELARRVPSEVARAVTLHGSPDRCAETIASFIDAGCRTFVLRITDPASRIDDAAYLGATALGSFLSHRQAGTAEYPGTLDDVRMRGQNVENETRPREG